MRHGKGSQSIFGEAEGASRWPLGGVRGAVGGGSGAAARRLGVPSGEERCATGVYDLPCAPMGVPRVWAIKRDHRLPLGEWGMHRAIGMGGKRADGLVVVFCRRVDVR